MYRHAGIPFLLIAQWLEMCPHRVYKGLWCSCSKICDWLEFSGEVALWTCYTPEPGGCNFMNWLAIGTSGWYEEVYHKLSDRR